MSGQMGGDPAPPDDDDLLEALRAENDELRVRIATLEAAADEYRRQMHEMLTSASWRATAALRGVAGKVRLARRRAKSLPRRVMSPHRSGSTPTNGLFPPAHRHPESGVLHPSPL